ncbi:MAG: TolC family protein [Victivallaceae bacterium]|nr:TolC family protein [Victivallaceae bacterium]
MKKHSFFALIAAAMLGGCYDYPPPPVSTLGETYSQRQRDEADEMFKDITSLSLADAQRIALHNNPTYIAAHHSVAAAHMRYLQSFAGYMPRITASFSLTGSDSWNTKVGTNSNDFGSPVRHPRTDSLNTNVGVQATMLLFDGLNREFGVMAASHSEKYYQRLDENACRTMMLAVAQAYNSVLLQIENRRIAEEDRKFQMTSLRDTQYKFDAGAVPLSSVLNFAILMNNAEVNVVKAEYNYESALYALALLMGYPDGTFPKEVKFSGHIKTDFVELPAVDVYLDTALANRPDLKGYREQLEIAKYQLYQQYASFSPTVNAFFNWGFGTNASYTNDYDTRSRSDNTSISYGIQADWTIFSGLARYNKMREYQANLAIADYQAAAQWFQVVNDVRTAYASYVQCTRATKLLQQVRDLSAKQRDLVDDEYRAGNTELTRLNEAQRDFVDAEANLATSYIGIQNARAQLDAAVGVNNASYYENQPEKIDAKLAPGMESLPPEQFSDSKETAPVVPQKESALPSGISSTEKSAPEAVKTDDAPAPAPQAEPQKVQPVAIPASATEQR